MAAPTSSKPREGTLQTSFELPTFHIYGDPNALTTETLEVRRRRLKTFAISIVQSEYQEKKGGPSSGARESTHQRQSDGEVMMLVMHIVALPQFCSVSLA